MLAQSGTLPTEQDRWSFEVKFDGIRAVAYIDDTLRLLSRNNNDVTAGWPELAGLAPADPGCVLDGEIVAFVDGTPSFGALQSRAHRRTPAAVSAAAAATPATFMIFDLLHVGRRPLVDLPYERRRDLLEQIDPRGPHWQISPRLNGRGIDLLARSRRLGLEGLIAKRLDGRYLPGRRSPLWTKLKNVQEARVIVVGYRVRAGARSGRIGSLLVAVPEQDASLRWVGNVGAGFSRAALAELHAKLSALHRDTPPVVNAAGARDVFWVTPSLVGEVSFTEWTREGGLRHPVWRGLREVAVAHVEPRHR